MKTLNIVIPMCGFAQRFKNAGFEQPKYLIDILKKTMLEWVIESLNLKEANYIYCVLKEHYEKYNLFEYLNKLTPNCTIIQVDKVTGGATETCLLSKQYINNDYPLLISNCDQYIEYDKNELLKTLEKQNDGVIFLFKSDGNPKWSYVEIKDGKIIRSVEKITITDDATTGHYYWNKGSDYVKYAELMIQKNIRTNNEFYNSGVYTEAILDNKTILPFYVDSMKGLGTPDDMQKFIDSWF